MFARCPKCGADQPATASQDTCGSCGLVFAKWVQRSLGVAARARPAEAADDAQDEDAGTLARLRARLLEPPPEDALGLWGRAVIYAALFAWGWYFIFLDFRTNAIGESFMHRVNLVFHEAGHVIFMPFGHFMMVLGGSLGQLLMPAIVGCALVWKNRDTFGGSVALWWFGQSLKDLAPYINDARDLKLMLLGGGTGADRPGVHDWENILLDLRLIEHERTIARLADVAGTLLMLIAMAWGAYILVAMHRNQSRS